MEHIVDKRKIKETKCNHCKRHTPPLPSSTEDCITNNPCFNECSYTNIDIIRTLHINVLWRYGLALKWRLKLRTSIVPITRLTAPRVPIPASNTVMGWP